MAKSLLMALPCAALLAVVLQGCEDGTEEGGQAAATGQPAVKREAVEAVVEQPVLPEIPNCDDDTYASAAARIWCKGLAEWKRSQVFVGDDNQKRDAFINAYGLGQQDASMASDPRPPSEQPVDQAGYQAGYHMVIEAQGLLDYACDSEPGAEYQDRWCDASVAYKNSGLGSADNAVLRGRYIDGYMSGRAIAVTIPAAMDVMLGSEARSGIRQAVAEPSAMKSKAERAFYQGFDEGHRAMLATIQESINQVMQQMHQNADTSPSMPGMESMMPVEPKPAQ